MLSDTTWVVFDVIDLFKCYDVCVMLYLTYFDDIMTIMTCICHILMK